MLAAVRTFAILGVEACEVQVEVDVRKGLPSFNVVGLPDAAVRESRERVRAAVSNSGFEFPQQRITASLAPADLRKNGTGYDLAIAAALLVASDQIPEAPLSGCVLSGELSLEGLVKPVAGAIAMAERAALSGLPTFVVAADAAPEALLGCVPGASGPEVVPIRRLTDLALLGGDQQPRAEAEPGVAPRPDPASVPDLRDLRGQPGLRFALEVAAAGGHGLLVLGPPGAGKSLAARRLPSIMPPLVDGEAREVLRIASACGQVASLQEGAPVRPFRAPHHTISPAGLVGGGSPPRPGEITLAHRGVLFLDELAEFRRDALEALRQPLEDGVVTIARARHVISLPCRFVMVAAANPCPCGRGEDSAACECTPLSVRRYRARLSGALADRIDIVIGIEQPPAEALAGDEGEASEDVRARVTEARRRALDRSGGWQANGELGPGELRRLARLSPDARNALTAGHAARRLSGRGHDRVLKVARTIADLDGSERIEVAHVERALTLRRRDG